MVGLSVVLESQQATTITTSTSDKKSAQVINKVIAIIYIPTPPPSPSTTPFNSSFPLCSFLDQCFLCKRTLLHTEDIYMYKGDTPFCSVECRCKQIFMDEEDDELYMKMKNKKKKTETAPKNNNGRDKCSLAAARRPPATSTPCLRKTRYN